MDPNSLVEECETALKVRKSARDIVVSYRNRPTVAYATLAKEVMSISSGTTVTHGSRR